MCRQAELRAGGRFTVYAFQNKAVVLRRSRLTDTFPLLTHPVITLMLRATSVTIFFMMTTSVIDG